MSDRTRGQAFVAVCLLVAGALVALLAVGGEEREPPRRGVSTAVAKVPPTPTPHHTSA